MKQLSNWLPFGAFWMVFELIFCLLELLIIADSKQYATISKLFDLKYTKKEDFFSKKAYFNFFLQQYCTVRIDVQSRLKAFKNWSLIRQKANFSFNWNLKSPKLKAEKRQTNSFDNISIHHTMQINCDKFLFQILSLASTFSNIHKWLLPKSVLFQKSTSWKKELQNAVPKTMKNKKCN